MPLRLRIAIALLCSVATATAQPVDGGAPGATVVAPPPAPPPKPFKLLREEVPAGGKRQLALPAGESFAGAALPIPVVVIHGVREGPVLCLTGGVHGDEVNGVEIVRRALEQVKAETLAGTLVGVPIVNLYGFRRRSRYLPDRRDLNRHFPGNSRGSAASRVAAAVFKRVIRKCDRLIDFHTGSFHRTNLPQVRADLRQPGAEELARAFREGVVLHKPGAKGTLRRAATDRNIPAIIYEAGEPTRLTEEEVRQGVQGVFNVMSSFEMIPLRIDTPEEPKVYLRSNWLRADAGGILLARVGLGDTVRKGDMLAHVVDPVSSERSEIRAQNDGIVLGMAFNQLVMPGFAAFHIAIEPRGDSPAGEPEEGSSRRPPMSVEGNYEQDERPE